jgi:hypothetical protein
MKPLSYNADDKAKGGYCKRIWTWMTTVNEF